MYKFASANWKYTTKLLIPLNFRAVRIKTYGCKKNTSFIQVTLNTARGKGQGITKETFNVSTLNENIELKFFP